MGESAARARLLTVLAEIADTATARSRDRCPYRAADDDCTFRGGCRNQRRRDATGPRCSGGHLNPGPAAGAPVEGDRC